MKTHVLTFAKHFMKGHPQEGKPTRFSQSIIRGVKDKDEFHISDFNKKIHTIRSNFEWWESKIREVKHTDAYLSLRYWSGKPYRSKQREFLKVHGNNVNKPTAQSIFIDNNWQVYVNGARVMLENVAKNDGLHIADFKHWFKDNLPYRGIIIHFTDFRY